MAEREYRFCSLHGNMQLNDPCPFCLLDVANAKLLAAEQSKTDGIAQLERELAEARVINKSLEKFRNALVLDKNDNPSNLWKLFEERDALRQQLEEAKRERDFFKNEVAAMHYDIEQAVAAERELLRRYGRHEDQCSYPECACSCGFAAAIRNQAPQQEAKGNTSET